MAHRYRDVLVTFSVVALDADSQYGPATGIGNMHMERSDGNAATIEQVAAATVKAVAELVPEAIEQLVTESRKQDVRESGNEGLN